MAELLSRSPAKAAPAPPKAAVPPPVVAQAAVAPQPQAPKPTATATVAPAPPEAADDLSATGHDLEVPANFPFANNQFDADDLSLPRGLLDEPLTSSSPAAPARSAQATKPASVIPQIEATRSFSDRLREHGRLSILLPAIIVLVVGLPSAGWFMWTRRSTPAPVAAAPPSRPILKSRRLPNAFMAHGLVAPISAASVSAQDVSAPPPTTEELVAPTIPKAIAPAPAAHAASGSGFSIQVAAVHGRDEADRMAAKLVQAGYSSYVVSGDGASAGFYRVRVGAFADRQAAEDVARKIELAEGVKPWIVKETR
jgi:septal ring-binding cell division protein DamX